MTAVAEAPEFAPGLYPDMPEAEYHADPVPGGSLSSTGARKLLSPGCPAKFKYELDHPPAPKKVFDLGRAAHHLVLGVGPELVLIEAEEWRTAAVKAAAAAVREEGGIPLKPVEYQQVHDMADALRRHPEAGTLLDPNSGEPEQSLFWHDRALGINRRARLDWFRYDGRVIDYKTTRSADLESLSKDVFAYGYHQQHDWYTDGLEALGLGDKDTEFTFVFQEKTPPYIVTVARLDTTALRIGHDLNRTALHLYAMCRRTGHWPGYAETVELLSLPVWVERLYA